MYCADRMRLTQSFLKIRNKSGKEEFMGKKRQNLCIISVIDDYRLGKNWIR
jgi:hypothetical protein